MRRPVSSWGRLSAAEHDVVGPAFAAEALAAYRAAPALAAGLGRSYGDVGLNAGGRLIVTPQMDHFIDADWNAGIVRAEAGLSLDQLLRVCVPRGWFAPVTPGTKYVTLGGAVANDVHGKNHEHAGSFGAWVSRLAVVRSDEGVVECGPNERADLFAATVGGLGLTGLILWVELQLAPIKSAYLDVETLALPDLDSFFRIAAESADWPYTVSWVDCLTQGATLGRGLFSRARWAGEGNLDTHAPFPRRAVPVEAPGWALNRFSIGAFNQMYRLRPGALGARRMHYDDYFYPLDGMANWNRLYGARGFFQHQSVTPLAQDASTVRALLEQTARAGQGSFLVVLKTFGAARSPGVLSFPMPGVTLALDLPNKGQKTLDLLGSMAGIVENAGGRLYPAKDATMSAHSFQNSYPDWRRVEAMRDPAIMSDFWRRVAVAQ